MFIICFLLILPFCLSTQDGNIQDSGKCGPQNLTLSTSKQVIQVTWEDDPSCLTMPDTPTYELQVLRGGELLQKAVLNVTADQPARSWNSSSLLALDCISHSVRLRYLVKGHPSPWKESQTIERNKSHLPVVYPKNQRLEVGSTVSFCCIVPEAQHFYEMSVERLNASNINTTMVSSRVYAFTFQANNETGQGCTHIFCNTTRMQSTCAYFGYPPDDKDLRCETRDLKSIECTWRIVTKRAVIIQTKTSYSLQEMPGEDNDSTPLVAVQWEDKVGRCIKDVNIDLGERTWKLTSENVFGKVELTDTADLKKRVRMFAPKELTISTDPSGNVSLHWSWEQPQYKDLNITCRVNISGGESDMLMNASGVGLNHAVLASGMPNVRRNVTVQCGTTAHFWKWGDPSASVRLEDVPDAPDVWMQARGDQVYVFCKTPPANATRARIVDYEVIWNATTGEQKGGKRIQKTCKPALILNDTGEYRVTLRARNKQHSSIPSAITVPSVSADQPETYRVIGSNGTFNLSLPSSQQAVCGYILDWCPTQRQCEDQWLKVPPSQTAATVHLETFDKGVTTSLSVYACTKGAPVLLEKMELLDCSMDLFKPLKLNQLGSTFEISWDRLNLREQKTFIKGYAVYYSNGQKQLNQSKDDPMATFMTVENLEMSTYTYTVVAQTPLGRCGHSPGSITLTGEDLPIQFWHFFIPVMFFTLMAILCYRYWTCLKEKMYPPIPGPVLTEKWPTAAECVAQHPEDEDTVNVCVLLSQQNVPCPLATNLSQLTKGNWSAICPAGGQSQAGLVFKGLLYNPSYNLPYHGSMDQLCHSCPDLNDGTPLERSAEGYQPQSQQNIFGHLSEEPPSLLTCSSYISLPQLDAK